MLGSIEQQIEYDIKCGRCDIKTAYRNRIKEAHQGSIYHNMMRIRKHMEQCHPNLLPWFDELNVLS